MDKIELNPEAQMALQKFGQILNHLKRTNGKPDDKQLLHAGREAAYIQEGVLAGVVFSEIQKFRLEWEKKKGRALDSRFEDEDYESL